MDVIKFVNTLPKTQANKIIIVQIVKSVTSMGANDQEADGAISRKDFVHRYGIVRKEGKESIFLLRLIGSTNYASKKKADKLFIEGGEIVAIVSKIISNANKTSTKNKKKKN